MDYDPLRKVAYVAERLNVDDNTVRRWIKSGVIDAIALPTSGKRKHYRVKNSVLLRLMNNPATAD